MEMKELHWLTNMLHNIDTGLLVLDPEYKVQLWNGFMANHSGLSASHTIGKSLFDLFPELPQDWFRHKMDLVVLMKTRAYITWEQKPYLIKFKNYRPITGLAEHMYQNATLFPLLGLDGGVQSVGVIIYDATDAATNKLLLEAAQAKLAELTNPQ